MKDLIKFIGALLAILLLYTSFFESLFVKRSPERMEALRARPNLLKQIRMVLIAAAVVYALSVIASLIIR